MAGIVGREDACAIRYRRPIPGATSSAIRGPEGQALHPNDPGAQTQLILERIDAALAKLGGSLKDVVETRIYVCDITQWDAIGRAHGVVFAHIRPATTMVEVSRLIASDLLVEISAMAVVDTPST